MNSTITKSTIFCNCRIFLNIFNLLQFLDSVYGLVSVWAKSRNECGNNYEFVRGLKKTSTCYYWQYESRTFVLGGQGIPSIEPETHVRRETNTFGCQSESLAIDGFIFVIYVRMKKKGLDIHLFTISMY